jgi:hypothetical protein
LILSGVLCGKYRTIGTPTISVKLEAAGAFPSTRRPQAMTVTFGSHDKPEMKPHEIAAAAGKWVIKHE